MFVLHSISHPDKIVKASPEQIKTMEEICDVFALGLARTTAGSDTPPAGAIVPFDPSMESMDRSIRESMDRSCRGIFDEVMMWDGVEFESPVCYGAKRKLVF